MAAETEDILRNDALAFVRRVLPTADEIAQRSCAEQIVRNLWPTIEAWRSLKKPTRRDAGTTGE